MNTSMKRTFSFQIKGKIQNKTFRLKKKMLEWNTKVKSLV